MKMEQSVPKRRQIKFRRRGIIQKKAYNIHNTAKVWNQEKKFVYFIGKYLLLYQQIEVRQCSLSFGAESFFFQVGIQKFKY